jgi:hypothetical protein
MSGRSCWRFEEVGFDKPGGSMKNNLKLLCVLAILTGCKQATHQDAAIGKHETAARALDAAADALAATEESSAVKLDGGGTGWTYQTDTDRMTDRTTKTACVLSTNMVNLRAPYQPVRAELCLRNSAKFGRDAFVQLQGDGQVLCRNYEPCKVNVRFEKGAVQHFTGIGAADYSTNIFYPRTK